MLKVALLDTHDSHKTYNGGCVVLLKWYRTMTESEIRFWRLRSRIMIIEKLIE
jgi:hypothetical protein